MTKRPFLTFAAALLSTALCARSQTVHDGGGKLPLTSSMLHSGADASHPNVYQNYLVRSTLNASRLSNVTITQCDIGQFSGNGILVSGGGTNVSITHCNFYETGSATGIYSNGRGTFVDCHFDHNTFDHVFEPIHLDFGVGNVSSNVTVSNNAITHYQRWAIELQGIITGLKVLNNYASVLAGTTQGGGSISVATGDGSNAGFTSGNEIASNVCIGGAGTEKSGAIENYGSGSSIHDNYVRGPWEWGILYCWTGLKGNLPWVVRNNTFVGVEADVSQEPFGTAAQNVPPTLTANRDYALDAADAPPVPTVEATVGAAPSTLPSPTTKTSVDKNPDSTATPTMTATAAADGIHLSGLPGTSGTLTWTATGNSPTDTPIANPTSSQTHSVSIAAGQTTFLDTSVPNQWRVVYHFAGATVAVTANAAQAFTAADAHPATKPSTTILNDLAALKAIQAQLEADLMAGK